MTKIWSLLNVKQKKLWPGLTERELCLAIALMQSDLEDLFFHKQGNTDWKPAAEAQEILNRHANLFDETTSPPFLINLA